MKQVQGVNVGRHEYEWYEMGFFTTWISQNSHSIFCFDMPQSSLADLTKAVSSSSSSSSSSSRTLDSASIYALHVIIIDEILKLFDTAVWSLRDTIREVELVDILSNFDAQTSI